MKTKYWIAILAVVLILCAGTSFFLLMPRGNATHAKITGENGFERIVDLRLDQEFTVTRADGGFNTVTVKNGAIAVTEASCPDQYCARRGWCSGGAQIVCLPNGLIITFLENVGVDAAAG